MSSAKHEVFDAEFIDDAPKPTQTRVVLPGCGEVRIDFDADGLPSAGHVAPADGLRDGLGARDVHVPLLAPKTRLGRAVAIGAVTMAKAFLRSRR